MIKVSDPSAGISVLTPSVTASVSRLGPAAASGQTQWVAVSNGKPSKYTLSFEVVGVG